MSIPEISVVIPTTGRPVIERALRTVLDQTLMEDVEIIVVVDGPGEVPALATYRGRHRLRVLYTAGHAGGGVARNLGVNAAKGRWVAYLDDDDTWECNKLQTQLAAGREIADTGKYAIITSRVNQQIVKTNRNITEVPSKVYTSKQSAAEYLFARRRPGSRRASLFTSTIFVDKRLALSTGWNPELKRHQDWDWLIRASSSPTSRIRQLPQSLATIYIGSENSISATPDWESSLEWAKAALGDEDDRVTVDFLVGQTLRYAIQARSKKGIRRVLSEIISFRSIPSGGPFVNCLAGVMPRSRMEAMMGWIR